MSSSDELPPKVANNVFKARLSFVVSFLNLIEYLTFDIFLSPSDHNRILVDCLNNVILGKTNRLNVIGEHGRLGHFEQRDVVLVSVVFVVSMLILISVFRSKYENNI